MMADPVNGTKTTSFRFHRGHLRAALAVAMFLFAASSASAHEYISLTSLKTGKVVRAGVGPSTYLAAVSAHTKGWETFRLVPLGSNVVALQSLQNGKYVTVRASGHLTATAQSPGDPERFRLIEGFDWYCLQSEKNHKYVRPEAGPNALLAAVSSSCTGWTPTWEMFAKQDLSGVCKWQLDSQQVRFSAGSVSQLYYPIRYYGYLSPKPAPTHPYHFQVMEMWNNSSATLELNGKKYTGINQQTICQSTDLGITLFPGGKQSVGKGAANASWYACGPNAVWQRPSNCPTCRYTTSDISVGIAYKTCPCVNIRDVSPCD